MSNREPGHNISLVCRCAVMRFICKRDERTLDSFTVLWCTAPYVAAGQIHSYQAVWRSPLANAASEGPVLLSVFTPTAAPMVFEAPGSEGQLRTPGPLRSVHRHCLRTCCHHVLFWLKQGYSFTAGDADMR